MQVKSFTEFAHEFFIYSRVTVITSEISSHGTTTASPPLLFFGNWQLGPVYEGERDECVPLCLDRPHLHVLYLIVYNCVHCSPLPYRQGEMSTWTENLGMKGKHQLASRLYVHFEIIMRKKMHYVYHAFCLSFYIRLLLVLSFSLYLSFSKSACLFIYRFSFSRFVPGNLSFSTGQRTLTQIEVRCCEMTSPSPLYDSPT